MARLMVYLDSGVYTVITSACVRAAHAHGNYNAAAAQCEQLVQRPMPAPVLALPDPSVAHWQLREACTDAL